MVKVLLWDIDGTVLNFLKAEEEAIKFLFKEFDLGVCSEAMLADYSAINVKYWQILERKEMTKPEILVNRFEDFFKLYNIPVEKAAPFNDRYQTQLGETIVFNDNSYQLIEQFKSDGYKQFAITNGTAVAQYKKLNKSNLINLFDKLYISEEVLVEKPDVQFFNKIFDENPYTKDEYIVIGDSLTSDIKGANNASLKCVWYNPNHSPLDKDVVIDYEIDNLNKLEDIIKNI